MAKILFDIPVVQAPAEWPDCHLVMELSRHIFSYAVVNEEKQLLQLRFYELNGRTNHDVADELDKIFATDEILYNVKGKRTLVYNFPESHLVPEKYFDGNTGSDMIELLHGDLNKGITLTEKTKSPALYNVFRIPTEVHESIKRNFANGEYWHYYSLWTQCWQKEEALDAQLSVMFYPNRILVGAIKNKELNLLQSYEYEAAEDVGYYLLNICDLLQLPPATTALYLSGMIDVSSVLYTEIFKYFGNITMDATSFKNAELALQDYPSHYFTPLLKLALCVS
ncbi:MAG: DUF3822 family protein [Chitinophagaceae bacterium]